MSFKHHLIIVIVIILGVYLAWQGMNKDPVEEPAAPAVAVSPYAISILHATWGGRCGNAFQDMDPSYDNYAKNTPDSARPQEDNVLSKISDMCNGKMECSITVNQASLGELPRDCVEKSLEVEYRCFSYDRPWRIRENKGAMTINCSRQNN